MARRRLGVLLAVLAGVLAWGWATDRAGPAFPHGLFAEVVGQTAVLVGLVGAVALLWRVVRNSADSPPTGGNSAEPGAAADPAHPSAETHSGPGN